MTDAHAGEPGGEERAEDGARVDAAAGHADSRSHPGRAYGVRMSPGLQAAGRRRYVSLTTFRRTGVPVATAVWIAPVGDALVVVTGGSTGKAKRLRNDPRVELRECSARGVVAEGAPVVLGAAEVVADPAEVDRLLAGHRAKYGWQFRAYAAVERLLQRGSPQDAVVLRIVDR